MSRTAASVQQELEAIESLLRHNGWHLMKTYIERNISTSALDMASNPTMSTDEMHFRRGAIYAAHNALTVPDKIQTFLKNELLFLQTQQAPAKAGAKGKKP